MKSYTIHFIRNALTDENLEGRYIGHTNVELSDEGKAQLAQMKEWMDKDEFDAQEKITWFTAMYNELGVKEVCERRIHELFAKCDAYIDAISVADEKKTALKDFANMLLNRNL